MESATGIALTGGFIKFVGETLAELKSQTLGNLDIDLLRLKKAVLEEKLTDYIANAQIETQHEKARVEQDMIDRGLSGSTVRLNMLQSVDSKWSARIQDASRDYARAIEELAILERRVKDQGWPWRHLLAWCKRGFSHR